MPLASHACSAPELQHRALRVGGGSEDSPAFQGNSNASGALSVTVGTEVGGRRGDGGSLQNSLEHYGLGPPGQFVSTVCWSRRGDYLLAANSVGTVGLLMMA
jgi:hypothetical protein